MCTMEEELGSVDKGKMWGLVTGSPETTAWPRDRA